MTTERQIAANRQNAQKSTGPRTQAGKAIASRNNARHGLYSSAPVIPRLESAAAWEAHRAATCSSLNPANPVEEALVERIALLLWRLGRVNRYEQNVTARAQNEAPDDLAAEYEDTDTDVAHIREQYAAARGCHRAFTRFHQLREDARMSGQDADHILGTVGNQVKGFDVDAFAVPGLIDADQCIADLPGWTVARIRQFVDAIAEATGRDADKLIQEATAAAGEWHARERAAYRDLDRELHHLRRERTLPQDTRLDNVIRYENHVDRQLNRALTQLRQMQRHREIFRPGLAYNDYHIDVDAHDVLPLSLARERGAGGEGFMQDGGPGGDVVDSDDSNPNSRSADVDGTTEFTPWQPRSRA